jgi:hypothetical protein
MTRRAASVVSRLLSTAVFILITGCSAQFKQAETVSRLLPDKASADALMAYAWSLSFNGTEIVVFPVEARGRRVLFSGADGLRLTWDGESIIVIEGMPGAFGRYESGVEPGGNERWYAQHGWPLQRADCTPRREWRLSERQYGWRQECYGKFAERMLRAAHSVEYDGRGNITRIEASSRPGASTFLLRRLN